MSGNVCYSITILYGSHEWERREEMWKCEIILLTMREWFTSRVHKTYMVNDKNDQLV